MGRPVSFEICTSFSWDAKLSDSEMMESPKHRMRNRNFSKFALRGMGGRRAAFEAPNSNWVDSSAWLGGGKLWGAFKGGRGKLTAAKSLVFNHSIAWSTFARCERADLQMFEPINYCQRSERAFLSAKGKRQHSGGNRGEVQKLNATQNEPIVRIGHQYHHLAPFGPSRWVKSFKIICKIICKKNFFNNFF